MNTIVCCIGWMKEYKGQIDNEEILGSGAYFDEHDTGGEIYNFYSRNGIFYGYVRNKNTFDLKSQFNCENDYLDNITVIWVSQNIDTQKTVVIGWYKNARIYKYNQKIPFKTNSICDEAGYNFEAKEEDCILLPIEERTLECPTGLGALGQQRFFYPKSEIAKTFINNVMSLIKYYEPLSQNELDIQSDIKAIKSSQIPPTTKLQLIQARYGQGKFRESLLSLYPECPITNINLNTLLRASHIKPWRNSTNFERLDKFNGLILTAHFDALFDKGYISFEDEGSLLISKSCIDVIDKLNINRNITIKIYDESKKYLKWHRDNIFIRY